MCYGVNTCLVLIMRLSGWIMVQGVEPASAFLSAFVPGFNADHAEWLSVLEHFLKAHL